jgi:COP9 signalosome complex subunit 6
MSSLTAKYNAIKMLHQRINLIKAYLAELPPSYLTDTSIPAGGPSDPPLNHQLLRSISSMISRLPLLAPPTHKTIQPSSSIPMAVTQQSSLATAASQEQSDVQLISLLASLTRSVAQAKELGDKYSIVQKAKTDKNHVSLVAGGRQYSNYGGPPSASNHEQPWDTPTADTGEFS